MPSDCAAISPSRMATKARPMRDRMMRQVNMSSNTVTTQSRSRCRSPVDAEPGEIGCGRAKAAGSECYRLPMPQHPLRRLCERERGEREKNAAQAQRRERQQRADHHRQHGAHRCGHPERPAQMHLQQRRSIGADAVDGGIGRTPAARRSQRKCSAPTPELYRSASGCRRTACIGWQTRASSRSAPNSSAKKLRLPTKTRSDMSDLPQPAHAEQSGGQEDQGEHDDKKGNES